VTADGVLEELHYFAEVVPTALTRLKGSLPNPPARDYATGELAKEPASVASTRPEVLEGVQQARCPLSANPTGCGSR
jgi:hypothetical protein